MFFVYAPGNGQPVKAGTREEADEIAHRHAERLPDKPVLILEHVATAQLRPQVVIEPELREGQVSTEILDKMIAAMDGMKREG